MRTPRDGGSSRENRFPRPARQTGGTRHPISTPCIPSQAFHPLGPDPTADPTASPKRSRPSLPPGFSAHPPSFGVGDGRGGSLARRRGPKLGGRCTPIVGAACLLETRWSRPRAEAGGGGGRSQAAEGRYLVTVAMVLLHGGSDSPRGRSDGRVKLRGRALASRENSPLFMSWGGTHAGLAFVSQRRRRSGSTGRVRGSGRPLPAASNLSGNKGWVLKSWELCQRR